MKKPVTIKVDETWISLMKVRIESLNCNKSDYIETLIKNDVESHVRENERLVSEQDHLNGTYNAERPLTVYAPVKMNQRTMASPQEEWESDEQYALFQEALDVISRMSGWDGKS